VFEHDARREGAAMRALVGYLPESAPLYPELTVAEYLRFRAGIMGLRAAGASTSIARAADRCDVAGFAHRCCGTLSKGMQQRVGLAAAILGDPRLVILDEPSVGLDPAQTLAFRTLVRELGETRLVLFSSHLLSEVESVCSELAVIAGGRVVLQEPIHRFRARAALDARMHAEIDRSVASDPDVRALCGDLSERTLGDGWYRIEFASAAEDPRAELVRVLSSRGVRVRSLGVGAASLEVAFVELVRAAAEQDRVSDRASGAAEGARP
jgi:ABC-2 type transport system ATP-binding protein